jgi:hypothetical protein
MSTKPPIIQPNQVTPPPPQPNKAFTNATVPKPPVEREIPDEEILARPLSLPDFINIKHKNPNMSLFWGNRAVGDKESKMRFSQLLAMGFVCAKPDDVHLPHQGKFLPCPESLAVDGRIIWGDLICLMIPKVKYVGQLKLNAENARNRVRKPGTIIQPDGKETPIMSGLQAQSRGKIQPYVPSNAEKQALMPSDAEDV